MDSIIQIPISAQTAALEEDQGRHRRTHLLKQADDIFADLRQAHDDVVGVDVAECGVITALPPHLVQHQVPAVHRGQEVLVFPGETPAAAFSMLTLRHSQLKTLKG